MQQRQRRRASSGQSRASSVDTVQSGDAISETIASTVVEEVPQEARGPVYNMYGREVARPYACRDDVGAFGILTGNWGGHRANKATQAAMDLDLKSGPATIICLQEAHEGVADVLAEPALHLHPRLRGMVGKTGPKPSTTPSAPMRTATRTSSL